MVRATILHRAARATLLVNGALLWACGRDQGMTGTGPMITIAVAPTTAVVHASGAVQLVATVSNDASNRGVSWKVSCAATSCGAISPAATPSGAATTYSAPATLPTGGATITITATAIADGVAAASATLVPVGQLPGYDVGIDYHSYAMDFSSTTFITIYDQPVVRQTVRAQLQGIADRGAAFVHTSIWFVTYPGTTNLGET